MHLCCISYHDCNLFQTLLRELQKCNDKYNILIMHITFNIGIGFMIVKRQTWLNNTKRYRAHTCIDLTITRCRPSLSETKLSPATGQMPKGSRGGFLRSKGNGGFPKLGVPFWGSRQ